MKHCFKCGQEKQLSEFYRHPMMADGRLGKCKDCTRRDVQQNYASRRAQYHEYERARWRTKERQAQAKESLRRHRLRYPEKAMARAAVSNAVRDGRLTRKPCEVCGESKSQAHHHDYSKPLNVQWLCFRHHRECHGQVVATQETT